MFDGELSMLIHPERPDEVETALGLAAQKLAEFDDAAGEANAHTVGPGAWPASAESVTAKSRWTTPSPQPGAH